MFISCFRQFSIALRAVLLAAPMTAFGLQYEYEEEPPASSLIETVSDLAALGEQAAASQQVIILAFSTEWCEYCEALDQQVLEPMLQNGDFAGRALLRKIMVDDVTDIRTFDGRRINTTRFAIERGVSLYPTLLFVDARGRERVRRIVGITVLEFAADNIARAVQAALEVSP